MVQFFRLTLCSQWHNWTRDYESLFYPTFSSTHQLSVLPQSLRSSLLLYMTYIKIVGYKLSIASSNRYFRLLRVPVSHCHSLSHDFPNSITSTVPISFLSSFIHYFPFFPFLSPLHFHFHLLFTFIIFSFLFIFHLFLFYPVFIDQFPYFFVSFSYSYSFSVFVFISVLFCFPTVILLVSFLLFLYLFRFIIILFVFLFTFHSNYFLFWFLLFFWHNDFAEE